MYLGSKGWPSGESTRLPPVWSGFKSRRRRHMWVKFVIGSLPCSERFFFGYSGFPLSPKTKFLAGRQHFSFYHRRYDIFMFFLQRNSSPLFAITRSNSFSVIHVSVDIKDNVEKEGTLLLFFLSKSPGGHANSCQIKP